MGKKRKDFNFQKHRFEYMAIRKNFIANSNSRLCEKAKQHRLTAHFNFLLVSAIRSRRANIKNGGNIILQLAGVIHNPVQHFPCGHRSCRQSPSRAVYGCARYLPRLRLSIFDISCQTKIEEY